MAHLRSGRFYLLAAGIVALVLEEAVGCRTGHGAECDKAPFVPGHNLAGEGFDVVRMRRTGAYVINVKAHLNDDSTCTLCPNHFHAGKMEKLPVAVLDWRPLGSYSEQLSGALHHSVDSLLRSSSSMVENNWGAGLSLEGTGNAVLGGSRSEMAKFARSQHSADKATFAIQQISYTYYSYRIADHPPLSAEFSKYLRRLPQSLGSPQNRALYRRLIDTYGTHYIHQVQLGGTVRRVTAFRTCLATLNGFSESQFQNCLNFKLNMSLGFMPVEAFISNKCDHLLKGNMRMGFYQGFMTHKIEVTGGNPSESYNSWMKSLHDKPDVVSYAIFPLHYLVEDQEVRENLKSLVTDYIKENRLQEEHLGPKNCFPSPNLDHNCCPLRTGRGRLALTIHWAAGLRGDKFSQTDAYIKIFYNDVYKKTATVMNDDNPVWNTMFNLGSVEMGNRLLLEVWDKDVFFDDEVGRCQTFPERGSYFLSCQLKKGVLYFSYTSTCDAHLTGYSCGRYSPSAE